MFRLTLNYGTNMLMYTFDANNCYSGEIGVGQDSTKVPNRVLITGFRKYSIYKHIFGYIS